MKDYDEKICRYALNRIFGFHPVTAIALLERFGSASALFSEGTRRILDRIGAGYRDIGRINDREYADAERELREVEASGARFLCENDPDYPALLRECADRPMGLYVRSESSDAEIFGGGRRFVAVVGTRDISQYGTEWCNRIVEALSQTKERPTIVSGLAMGTDITAHRKALADGLATIAVLPTGIDAVYPHRHRHDARKIVSTPGCALVTDYPPGTAPLQYNFLRRNRIIAGLSEATVLVESKIRGGGMMTAHLAASYSRDVYALPGRIGDLRSEGCNSLIRDRIAEAVTSGKSLADGLGMKTPRTPARPCDRELVTRNFSGKMDPAWIDKLAAVILAVRESGGADIEQISKKCSLDYKETVQLIYVLETDGLVKVDMMQRCTINYG